jgi:hypothetical protein
MSNITSQMTIDYNAIIDELIGKGDNKECRKRIEELSDEFNGLETGEFLREHRTIGFHNTRQTGKTAWVNEQFINRPGEVSIVTVNAAREADAMTHAKSIDRSKFFTATDIVACVGGHPSYVQRICKTKCVIVTDSMYVLDRVGYSHLYKWLALSDNRDMWIILT